MMDLKAFLAKLHQNLNILREREAKYGGNVPLDLLNQIDDHEEAITLTRQAIQGEISGTEWREALKTFNLAEPGLRVCELIGNHPGIPPGAVL